MDDEYLRTVKSASSKGLKGTRVTVTHSHHPLKGMNVEVVKGSRNPASPLVIRIPEPVKGNVEDY
jgi:hypothetical protein